MFVWVIAYTILFKVYIHVHIIAWTAYIIMLLQYIVHVYCLECHNWQPLQFPMYMYMYLHVRVMYLHVHVHVM